MNQLTNHLIGSDASIEDPNSLPNRLIAIYDAIVGARQSMNESKNDLETIDRIINEKSITPSTRLMWWQIGQRQNVDEMKFMINQGWKNVDTLIVSALGLNSTLRETQPQEVLNKIKESVEEIELQINSQVIIIEILKQQLEDGYIQPEILLNYCNYFLDKIDINLSPTMLNSIVNPLNSLCIGCLSSLQVLQQKKMKVDDVAEKIASISRLVLFGIAEIEQFDVENPNKAKSEIFRMINSFTANFQIGKPPIPEVFFPVTLTMIRKFSARLNLLDEERSMLDDLLLTCIASVYQNKNEEAKNRARELVVDLIRPYKTNNVFIKKLQKVAERQLEV